jgi:hypothetical protein
MTAARSIHSSTTADCGRADVSLPTGAAESEAMNLPPQC